MSIRMTEAEVRAHNAGVVKAMTTKNKYGAKKVQIDGYTFDSKHEGKRYSALKLMLQSGVISELEVHPAFPIFINGIQVCNVELDFRYWDFEKRRLVYEDTKGKDTDISRLKRKMVEAEYRIKVDLIK